VTMLLRLTFYLLIFILTGLSAVPQLSAAPAKDGTNFTIAYIAGRKYYRAADMARYLRLKLIKVQNRYEMTGAAGRMVFTPQKRFGSFNGIVINYNFEPMVKSGELYISSSDFFDHVQVLFNPRCLRANGIRTIIIDPGHGGKDQGAAGLRNTEKALTLQIANRVQKHLRKLGYKVLMTRVSDRKLELSERANLCNRQRADLFVSIHMNAAGNRTVRGIETFALTSSGAPSSGSTKVQYNQYPGENAAKNSFSLAWHVQNQLIRILKAPDRGVKRARFVVLRETRCPSILIECGFISNRTEENLLAQANYQENLAIAITRGIYDYHRNLRSNR